MKTLEHKFKQIKDIFGNSTDIKTRIITIGDKQLGYVFLDSVCSGDKISDFLMKSTFRFSSENLYQELLNKLANNNILKLKTLQEVIDILPNGFTCVLSSDSKEWIAVETKGMIDRGVNEASGEAIIRGPKDSFTENYMINLGLIRKRIKDPNLWISELLLGRRTQTKIAITYLRDVVPKKRIQKIEKRLREITIDGILDSGYIREYLVENKHTVFPQMVSTERPDLACQALLEGKIIIMVENSPIVLICPGVFIDFFHSPEDFYQKNWNVNFARIIRFFSFLITLLLPAFYVAITTFNPEMIPDELLFSIVKQRSNVPFPTFFEVLILMLAFEILRETDIRMPQTMGTAISVVGGLILGDAAVSAGIVSPISIIVIAMTSICGLLFSDVDMINGLRVWRFLFLISGSILGVIGIVIMGLLFITNLCSTRFLGIPYMTTIAPFNLEDSKDSIIKVPTPKITKRPTFLTKRNRYRQKEEKHEKD